MGCSNGKAIKIAPAVVVAVDTDLKDGEAMKRKSGSQSSLRSGERPFGSATSKGSNHSNDSGYSGQDVVPDDECDDYANIITEHSDDKIVKEIESGFHEQELDLCLTGIPAPRNLSAKDKARLDEQRILEDLRNEGLIATSKFEARSGLAFEVVEASNQLRRALPARLAKINKKKKKTKEEIAAKLEKAERRRKEAKTEKLEKINAVTGKSESVQIHEENTKQQQQERLENTLRKEDEVAEKKKQRIQELKDKLKAKQEHAEKVRLRRKLHIPTQEELDTIAEQERQLAEGQFTLPPIPTAEG